MPRRVSGRPVYDFVQWAIRNHALLLQRARQSPPAEGAAAANLLRCLRQTCSSDERRYYMMLHALIVQRYRAPSSEETRLLSGVWSSVSTALRAEPEDADATMPATPGAGVPVPGAGCELGAHAAALRATAPAECIPEHAMLKNARASVPGTGLHGHVSPMRPAIVDLVRWAHHNHALLLQRARQGPLRRSRFAARGTAAANLLGCLRTHHSTDERRYHNMLHRIIVGRYRAPCSEETRQLGEVWSSVSTTLRAELKDADATPPVTPSAGVPAPGAGRELGAHAAALCATALAASIPGRATPKKARASVPDMGLRGHTSLGSARLVEVTPARCGKKRRI